MFPKVEWVEFGEAFEIHGRRPLFNIISRITAHAQEYLISNLPSFSSFTRLFRYDKKRNAVKALLFLLLLTPLAAQSNGFVTAPDMSILSEYSDPDPDWPTELIKISPENYERNTKATFCLRPIEMVDTIVIHHSETSSTTTAAQINQFHLARGTPQDPWYMIAYSYVINAAYSGATTPKSKVTEGRPLGIVGAHAGTNVFIPMDSEQTKLWNEGKVVCGKEGEEPKFDPTLVQQNKIKANVTTIGVVVNGNYSPFSRSNPGGYSKNKPRYPTANTQDMIARLSCQLQKKYPRMTYLRWHNFYHETSCPGTIKSYIGQIKTIAKRYGCEFK